MVTRPESQANEIEVRELIDRWAAAVRNEDVAGIAANHDPDMLMFDVPPPFMLRGLDAYMKSWKLFFANVAKPVSFNFEDIEITSGSDVAFATAKGRCIAIDRAGKAAPLEFRLTMGLRKIDGEWRILHEHHSVPATD